MPKGPLGFQIYLKATTVLNHKIIRNCISARAHAGCIKQRRKCLKSSTLSFIPPTTSESYLSHLMKANYNFHPPHILSVTVAFSLDIQMLTLQGIFTCFHCSQEKYILQNLAERTEVLQSKKCCQRKAISIALTPLQKL